MSQDLKDNLLITGAGILLGGAIMALTNAQDAQGPKDQDTDQDQAEPMSTSSISSSSNTKKEPLGKQAVMEHDLKQLERTMSHEQGASISKLGKKVRSKTNLLVQQEQENEAQEVPNRMLKRTSTSSFERQSQLLQVARPIIDLPLHLLDLVEHDIDNPPFAYESPLLGDNAEKKVLGGTKFMPDDSFMDDDAFVIASKDHMTIKDIATSVKFVKAGPRKQIHFDVDEVRAAIVTCGGLCPGLNVVIREIVMSLHFNYEVKHIYGIRWGYKGFYTETDKNWVRLTPREVSEIHKAGGTFLGSSRGGFDGEKDGMKILTELKKKKINQVYIIGGDGTHRGIYNLCKLAEKQGIEIAFAGIPKTIDNDIPMIDSSFGFATSCEVAAQMIQSAYIEATCVINGIGLVKLMGRHSGYIAMMASLGHGGVDFCLVPENPFELEGENGLYAQIYARMQEQGHAVVVVAEGAEDGLINAAEKFTKAAQKDASGNVKLSDIGEALKSSIVSRLKTKYGFETNLKYIDPTYAIRSVAANAQDTIMCAKLAQNAVHGAMAGYTAFTTGIVRNATSWIPITTINGAGVNKISVYDRMFNRLLGQLRQRPMVNQEFKKAAQEKIDADEKSKKDRFDAIVDRIKKEDQEREAAKNVKF